MLMCVHNLNLKYNLKFYIFLNKNAKLSYEANAFKYK